MLTSLQAPEAFTELACRATLPTVNDMILYLSLRLIISFFQPAMAELNTVPASLCSPNFFVTGESPIKWIFFQRKDP